MTAPQANEYPPFYAGYVQLAAAYDDVILLLHDLKDSTYNTFNALPAQKAAYAYAAGKWTVKQVLAHLIDTERIFSYRLYCISRGDKAAFPGFDQDIYVQNNNLTNRTIQNLAKEFRLLRNANLCFIKALTDAQLATTGTASGNPVTAKALIYMMAGHELHHLKILKDRYWQV